MLTVNELFAGIGAFRKALIRLGIPHEVVGISEIDKYAIKSYNAIYGETRNYGDISKVGGHEVKIMDNRPIVRIAEATKKGFAEATIGDSINIAYPNSNTRRGRVCEGKANTLSTSPQQAVITEDSNMENIRIRKLTPRECWRLMGFDDEDFNKARAVNSDTQLYKQAGNSIVVNVLEAIMGNMFINDYISQ